MFFNLSFQAGSSDKKSEKKVTFSDKNDIREFTNDFSHLQLVRERKRHCAGDDKYKYSESFGESSIKKSSYNPFQYKGYDDKKSGNGSGNSNK